MPLSTDTCYFYTIVNRIKSAFLKFECKQNLYDKKPKKCTQTIYCGNTLNLVKYYITLEIIILK